MRIKMNIKTLLSENDLPKNYYNIIADLPTSIPPVLHPGTKKPVGPEDLSPLFPMELIKQEVSNSRFIEIPDEVIDIYKLYRPSPLYRARSLEKLLDTPAKIYYKYEGVSPTGSHKPNTAIPQAYYNKEEGIKKITTETGAGQWGSSLAFACSKFGIDLAMEGNKISVLTDDGDFYMFNVDGTKKAGPFRDPRGTVSTDEGNRTPKFMGVKMSGNIAAIITNDGSTNEVYPNMGDDSDGNKVKRIWYHDTNNLNEGITTAVSHRVRASTNTHINWGNTNRGGPGSLFSTSSPTNDFYQYGFDIHGYQTIVGAPYQSDANATTTDKKGVGRLYLYGDSTGSDYVLGSEAWQTSDSRSPLTSTAYTVSVGTGPLFGQAGTEGNVFYLEESA